MKRLLVPGLVALMLSPAVSRGEVLLPSIVSVLVDGGNNYAWQKVEPPFACFFVNAPRVVFCVLRRVQGLAKLEKVSFSADGVTFGEGQHLHEAADVDHPQEQKHHQWRDEREISACRGKIASPKAGEPFDHKPATVASLSV